MSEARRLFEHQQRQSSPTRAAGRLRLAEEPANAPKPDATTVRLVRDGWDYQIRCGKLIYRHEEVFGGAWYGAEMAMRINDERKGSR
ncbi:hypothetical protein GBA65_15055 [Rubrobacter marinus]|uniref:Uncharacterized protein n=1 Tax=Rubrobacter marinus TaxID=2653852 RepID=A0A6G8PZH7_9ACTN|nr:hypothetical protein [Rubrobacter marinus]QIN79623.1 hypothetical protein GBA65_15055 [Rubrobacter marinus]